MEDRRGGFNLITMSILLAVASIIMVQFLPGQQAGDVIQKAGDTIQRLNRVETALTGYMAFNGRLPCPADGQYAVNNHNFGLEAATPGTCTGGTPAAPFGPDAGTGFVVGGVIPTKSLHLDDSYAFDEWGRRITYVVDKRVTLKSSCLTQQNFPTNNGKGGIVLHDGSGATFDNVMHAFIVHGPDGHGAFPEQGSSVANRVNTGTIDTDKLTNAGVDSSFAYSTANFTNVKVMKDRTATFGDLVYYAEHQKNVCCVGGVTNCAASYGFRVDGTTASQGLGQGVSTVDINGDGIPDLIIADANGNIFVVFGQSSRGGFPNPLPVTSLNGTNGFEVTGVPKPNVITGDFNGDGIQDIAIVSNTMGPTTAYILYGQANGWPASIDVSALTNASNPKGTKITGLGNNGSFYSLAAGNVNGDTNAGHAIDDLIIGGPYENSNKGNTYVVFGSAAPASSVAVGSLNGTTGVKIAGSVANGFVGEVAAGDFNADGVKDIAIGAGSANNISYIIWGHSGAWTTPVDLGALAANGSVGVKLYTSQNATDRLGMTLGVSDLNGDGKDDLLLFSDHCIYAACGGHTIEAAYAVIFGHTGWAAANSFDLNTLNGATGTEIAGVWDAGDQGFACNYGWDCNLNGVPGFADIGGDSKQDLLALGQYGGGHTKYYAIFGNAAWSNLFTTDTLNGSNGFRFTTTSNVANAFTAGDIDGDGIADYLLGDQGASSSAGAVYVVKGARSGYPATIDYSAIATYGWQINGAAANDLAGGSIATGDVDHDGKTDVAIAAPGHSPGGVSGAGSVYVLWGNTTWASPTNLGTVLP